MSVLGQVRSVTVMGLRSVPARFGTSTVIVIGVAAVVAVLVSALAIASGFTNAAARAGDPNRAIVLTGDTEAASNLTRENVFTILNAPGVRVSGSGVPISSAEPLEFIGVTDEATGLNAYIALRGVSAAAGELRPEVKLVEGRTFEPGVHELVVGRAVQRRLGGAVAMGSTLSLPNGEWAVVGVFESNGDSHESEMLTDAETLLDAYRSNQYNSVTVRLEGDHGFEQFRAALDADPTLSVAVLREDEYFAAASGPISSLLTAIAYGIGGIMAFGALFGALNTLYSAVGSRATEIATLRAIGFGSVPVVVSVLAEALLLALAGALIGALLAWLALDGSSVSTMTGNTPSQLTFGLEVGPELIFVGVLCGAAIALVGGAFAAIRAARVSVATGLRMI